MGQKKQVPSHHTQAAFPEKTHLDSEPHCQYENVCPLTTSILCSLRILLIQVTWKPIKEIWTTNEPKSVSRQILVFKSQTVLRHVSSVSKWRLGRLINQLVSNFPFLGKRGQVTSSISHQTRAERDSQEDFQVKPSYLPDVLFLLLHTVLTWTSLPWLSFSNYP